MLFAGPYNNEFGHELFSFQGIARRLSRAHKKTIVCSKPSMKFLYEDFADEFVATSELTNLSAYEDYTFLSQDNCAVGAGSGLLGVKQEFVKYGKPSDEEYDIIIHARTKEAIMCPNIDNEIYDLLYRSLSDQYRIAFIGTKAEAYCPPAAEDLREIKLEKLADILYNSQLVLGHSSGPIHFASLCGATHLTWGGYRPRTFFRYAHTWNPFKTKCYIFENLDQIGYLKNRAGLFGANQKIFKAKHLNIINEKNFRVPTLNALLNGVRKILNE